MLIEKSTSRIEHPKKELILRWVLLALYNSNTSYNKTKDKKKKLNIITLYSVTH